MVKLRNSFLESKIQHKHQQCDEMLSTFMKVTRINKLKNKIIALFSSVSNCERFLYDAISFVFVEKTPFGTVKP